MTQSRSHTIAPDEPGTFLLTCRCVRRAFLCGFDPDTDQDFEHRRQWFVDRLRQLLQVYAVDVLAYTLMCNHYHLVVHVDPDRVARWSDEEVWQRWLGALVRDPNEPPPPMPDAERLAVLRSRLGSISWFMKGLNECIARKVNREDGCTGHFWESRFHSRRLLDEAAVVSAMAYVDLNPVRAKVVDRLEKSPWTSICQRIAERDAGAAEQADSAKTQRHLPLAPLDAGVVPAMTLSDYLELLDYAARQRRPDKPGWQDAELPPIATRLGLSGGSWAGSLDHLRHSFGKMVGTPERLESMARSLSLMRIRGRRLAERMFANSVPG